MQPENKNNDSVEKLAKEWVEQIRRVRDGQMRNREDNCLNEVVTAEKSGKQENSLEAATGIGSLA